MTDTLSPTHDETPTRELPPPAAPEPREDRPRGWVTVVAAAIVAALVSAGMTTALNERATPALATPQAQPVADVERPASVGRDDIASVASAVSPSVVFLEVAGAQGQGSGSGVVLREDGYVLTNAHVVQGATAVRVTLPDGNVYDAEVVGGDTASDLAVVKLDGATDLPVPEFADAGPRVGELAIAIGSPFGLEGSVTSGIVSALNRSVPGERALVNMIQTDAAINPGNSGGALANGSGEVIGINTAILSPSGANDGIGFAIPIDTALPIAEQLIDKGYVEHAQLGIQGQDVNSSIADLYNLGAEQGALVAAVVPDSAAEDAGLERGDIVTAIDDEPVSSMADLAGQISAHAPGDTITLTVVRGAETLTLEVTLGSAPRAEP